MLTRRDAVELLQSQVEHSAYLRQTLRETDPDLTALPWWPEYIERTKKALQEGERFRRYLRGFIRHCDVIAAQPTR